jgi:hypothetical protein
VPFHQASDFSLRSGSAYDHFLTRRLKKSRYFWRKMRETASAVSLTPILLARDELT